MKKRGRDSGKPRHASHRRDAAHLSERLPYRRDRDRSATGELTIARYTAVDDCGTVLNHMIVEGQVHGSLAQGLGQALLENIVYDSASGQLVSGSFMDYAMPRAEHMPVEFRDGIHSVPATTNPIGVKGAGEAGTTAAIAAVMNAVADAIPNGAGAHLDMPVTPEKLWRACQAAQQAG